MLLKDIEKHAMLGYLKNRNEENNYLDEKLEIIQRKIEEDKGKA